MARRAPLKATGEPRAPTFNTSGLLQTRRGVSGLGLDANLTFADLCRIPEAARQRPTPFGARYSLTEAIRTPRPLWVLPSPKAIRGHRARHLGSRWPKFSLVVVHPPRGQAG